VKESNILNYLPPVLSEIKEFQLIANAEDEALNILWKKAEDILNNQFCDTLDETGLSRFEKILSLNSDGDINFRRFKVKTAMGNRTPFTVKALTLQLNSICGAGNYELSVDCNRYEICVYLTSLENAEEVRKLLNQMAPANMVVEVSLLYRRYSGVGKFRHSALGGFTHGYIKEGEIN